MTVRDNGAGMDDATRRAAFDPFFSGRPEGQGLGLGLYLVRGHLRQLGGDVSLESRPEGGSTVEITFPLIASMEVG